MKFPFFIAKRYLFTSKSKNVVNIISYITLFGVAIGTAAYNKAFEITTGAVSVAENEVSLLIVNLNGVTV